MYTRNKTRKIRVGDRFIGGGSPVLVQSMTNTDTRDLRATLRQARELEEAGSELIRVTVPDMVAARNLKKIKKGISVPLVADIHFDHRLALEAIAQGVDKLRINPGNIGSDEKVAAVVKAAKKAGVPIRIGVNAGSLKRLHAGGKRSADDRARGLVAAALDNIRILESLDFFDTIVSLKASDVPTTVAAYRLLSSRKNYPLHLGVTEAGSLQRGTIKSSVGLGILLQEGLGDTLRVSLTADPVEEIKVAYAILQSLELRSTGIDIISCPTCGRCAADLIAIVNEFESRLARVQPLTAAAFKNKPLKVALMGCVVNGPGEAKEADIGIAGGKDGGLLFEKGAVIGKVAPRKWVSTLLNMVTKEAKRRIAS